ncbi:MAG: ThiF family adenylyltransferase [Dissulfurispiraceae bacterium]|jgi:molybdopterin/thiamine biosynthesis adenylyltransferase|nr:ThiF family adenylyltransferase [Dissulfurispiraceae bacterium]
MDVEKLITNEFRRNIGLLTEKEQKTLLHSRAAVAGAGGVGGLHILTLARSGVSAFNIADPDNFEAVNVSRQFGAFHSTIGKNKAETLAEMVKDINPAADVRVFKESINSANVDDFLKDADIFIDGIDFFEIEARRLLFKKARDKKIFAITAAPLGFGATLQTFSPQGMSFDEYFGIKDSTPEIEKLAAFAAGLAPHPYHIKYMDLSKVSLTAKTGPALALACTLCASIAAAETIKILTGKGEVKAVPHYTQIDLLRNKFRRGYIYGGGKNPFQLIKKWIILKKAGSSA